MTCAEFPRKRTWELNVLSDPGPTIGGLRTSKSPSHRVFPLLLNCWGGFADHPVKCEAIIMYSFLEGLNTAGASAWNQGIFRLLIFLCINHLSGGSMPLPWCSKGTCLLTEKNLQKLCPPIVPPESFVYQGIECKRFSLMVCPEAGHCLKFVWILDLQEVSKVVYVTSCCFQGHNSGRKLWNWWREINLDRRSAYSQGIGEIFIQFWHSQVRISNAAN